MKSTELTYMLVCTNTFRRDLEAPSAGKDGREIPWNFVSFVGNSCKGWLGLESVLLEMGMQTQHTMQICSRPQAANVIASKQNLFIWNGDPVMVTLLLMTTHSFHNRNLNKPEAVFCPQLLSNWSPKLKISHQSFHISTALFLMPMSSSRTTISFNQYK